MIMGKALILFLLIWKTSCKTKSTSDENVLYYNTTFYNIDGRVSLMNKVKLWQKDSTVIQENYTIKTNTTHGVKTTKYIPLFCRYIDLKTRCFYDYLSFSDTATCYRTGKIDHLTREDNGYHFFWDHVYEISSSPTMLSDTTIKGQTYMRAKYYLKDVDSTRVFFIGFFPVKQSYNFFSIEDKFSRQKNWFMKINHEYHQNRANFPSVISEVDFIENKFSEAETQVFNAWEEYARDHPVK